MNRKETTQYLSKCLEKYLNPHLDPRIYIAKEVTFDYATSHEIRVDYMLFKPVNNSVSGLEKGNFYCYEIKSCVDDFNSGHGLNFIGDYNYIVTTQETFEQIKSKIPHYVGVLVPSTYRFKPDSLESVKNAKRKDRTKPLIEMLFMMFRSSNRELYKYYKENIK